MCIAVACLTGIDVIAKEVAARHARAAEEQEAAVRLARIGLRLGTALLMLIVLAALAIYGFTVHYQSQINQVSGQAREINEENRELEVKLGRIRSFNAAAMKITGYTLEEVYSHAMYDQVPDYIPQPGWFIIDAGANAGVFTVVSASRGARLAAVEPNQQCFERLVGNVRENGLAAMVQPIHAALGAHAGAR